MPTTTEYAFPYPAPTDAPDVPYWAQQLAEAIEAKVLAANKPHMATVIATSAQSIPNTTTTRIQFPATPDAIYGCTWDDANDEITITKAGLYLLIGSVGYSANATGPRYAIIGYQTNGISSGVPGGTGGYIVPQAHGLRKLNVGDKVWLETNQYSGAALNTYHGNDRTQLSVIWVGELP